MAQAPMRPEIMLPMYSCSTDAGVSCSSAFDGSDATTFTFSASSNSVNSYARIDFPTTMYIRQVRIFGQQGVTDMRMDFNGASSQTISGISTSWYKLYELSSAVTSSYVAFYVTASTAQAIIKDIQVMGLPLDYELTPRSCSPSTAGTCSYATDNNGATSWLSYPATNADLQISFTTLSTITFVSLQPAPTYAPPCTLR
eukprot:TRINITY_DN22146_c0_g1_i1.p1 TRINITY_DN22146_c0_g1~~TRINITY_DN22146_c0_g1_i1.p1  ORF type:complete len:232 (-),score=26.27 TRINITY_DN22146_c0_g1_i1:12-608(-)